MAAPDRFAFVAEYFDVQANLTRQYQVLFYTSDASIEMYDMKTRRVFLKRSPFPSVDPKELYVGATITVYARQLKIVDFGDEVTRSFAVRKADRGAVVISSNGYLRLGSVLEFCRATLGLRISSVQKISISSGLAKSVGIPEKCVVAEVIGASLSEAFGRLRDQFPGIVSGVADAADCARVTSLAQDNAASCAVGSGTSICIIKPHAVLSGMGPRILQRIIDEGFDIIALGSFSLSAADAEDFLEVYKGVVPEYKKLVDEFSSGQCWAVEVRAENVVEALRTVCGPHDPEICKALFPLSIRAEFGSDKVKNAVHCTDLEEDASLESEFFFRLLNQAGR